MCVTNFTRFVSRVLTLADIQNKAAASARFAYLTLQVLMKMDEFVAQGSSHPVFVAATQEFLMQIMASNGGVGSSSSDVDVSKLEDALAQEVRYHRNECADVESKLTKKHNALSSKVDRVVRANRLKTTVANPNSRKNDEDE